MNKKFLKLCFIDKNLSKEKDFLLCSILFQNVLLRSLKLVILSRWSQFKLGQFFSLNSFKRYEELFKYGDGSKNSYQIILEGSINLLRPKTNSRWQVDDFLEKNFPGVVVLLEKIKKEKDQESQIFSRNLSRQDLDFFQLVYSNYEFVRKMGAGSHLGEIALICNSVKTTAAVCLTQVELIEISKEGFLKLLGYESILGVRQDLNSLRRFSFFSDYQDDQLYSLKYCLKCVEFKMGGIIFKEGDEVQSVYLVQEGQVDYMKPVKVNGKKEEMKPLVLKQGGGIIGQDEIFQNLSLRQSRAVARSEIVRVWELEKKNLVYFLTRYNENQQKFYQDQIKKSDFQSQREESQTKFFQDQQNFLQEGNFNLQDKFFPMNRHIQKKLRQAQIKNLDRVSGWAKYYEEQSLNRVSQSLEGNESFSEIKGNQKKGKNESFNRILTSRMDTSEEEEKNILIQKSIQSVENFTEKKKTNSKNNIFIQHQKIQQNTNLQTSIKYLDNSFAQNLPRISSLGQLYSEIKSKKNFFQKNQQYLEDIENSKLEEQNQKEKEQLEKIEKQEKNEKLEKIEKMRKMQNEKKIQKQFQAVSKKQQAENLEMQTVRNTSILSQKLKTENNLDLQTIGVDYYQIDKNYFMEELRKKKNKYGIASNEQYSEAVKQVFQGLEKDLGDKDMPDRIFSRKRDNEKLLNKQINSIQQKFLYNSPTLLTTRQKFNNRNYQSPIKNDYSNISINQSLNEIQQNQNSENQQNISLPKIKIKENKEQNLALIDKNNQPQIKSHDILQFYLENNLQQQEEIKTKNNDKHNSNKDEISFQKKFLSQGIKSIFNKPKQNFIQKALQKLTLNQQSPMKNKKNQTKMENQEIQLDEMIKCSKFKQIIK